MESRSIVEQLSPIFKPASIAIIGASKTPGKWGFMMVDRPVRTGYRGVIHVVNPKGERIHRLEARRSILDVPDPVDLAVITVPAPSVPQVMRECIQKGVKGAVLISAGFAETGEEGKALQQEVVRIAREGGIRFVGPNCMGLWSSAGRLNLAFDQAPRPGPIAFVSQSGTFGGSLSEIASEKGYGLSQFVSIGNQADLTASDYLEYLAEDERTRVVVFYMEGFKDGRRFFDLARKVAAKKPIVIYKAGRTEAGTRATLSHTASLAGREEVFDGICRQAGLIRTQEALQAFEVAEALALQPLPKGRRVAILGSGGQGVVTADACASLGLEVPELDADTVESLRKLLPPHAPRPTNPVDFAGSNRSGSDEALVVEALLQRDYIDGVISNVPLNPVAYVATIYTGGIPQPLLDLLKLAIQGAEHFASLPKKYGKPVVAIRFRRFQNDLVQDILNGAGIPIYDTPEECARAMHALARYAEIRKAVAGLVGKFGV